MIEKLDGFGDEIAAVGDKIRSQLGSEDLAYLKKIKKLSNISEILGRSFLYLSLDPLSWSVGVVLLGVHHQLETGEIGHSALHGVWDGLKGAEQWDSKRFCWATPVDEEFWKKEHNILHHQYTNIVGLDPDLNYGALRVTEKTRWIPYHLIQVSQFFWTAPFFIWMIAAHAAGLTDLTHPQKDKSYAPVLSNRKFKTILKASYQTLHKMLPYAFYEFVFWPLLAGPFWWKILVGNLGADVLRNVYSSAMIYAGHFGDDLKYYDQSFKAHGRGEWYKAQVEAAHNYTVPGWVSLLCGALDHQIEHHLFPRLPPNRLREIAPKIEKICRDYQVHYNKTSWGKNLFAALKRLAKMSIPSLLPSYSLKNFNPIELASIKKLRMFRLQES